MRTRGRTNIASACLLAAALAAPAVRASVVVDFETPTDFANNFRKISGVTPNQTTGQSNNYLSFTGNNFSILAYDTTPGDGTATTSAYTVSASSPLSITTDAYFASNNSSFGIFIIDATNEANGYLALFNVNATGVTPNDQIRFSGNAIPNGTSATNAGTLNTPGKTSADAAGLSAFATINVTYSIDGSNHPVLTLTANPGAANAYSDTITFSTITTPLTNVEIGYRLSSQAGGTGDYRMDNAIIDGTPAAPTPEPATLGAGGFAATLLLARRRRS